MKYLCIYHKNCADGFGSALAAKTWMDQELIPVENRKFLAAQYGDKAPDVTGNHVFILDFSYGREDLIKMHSDAESLIVIDHHKTAEEALKGLSFCKFDMSRSGAMLAWLHFFPEDNIDRCSGVGFHDNAAPSLINYIQDRDLWTWELPLSKSVSAAISSLPMNFDDWRPYLHDVNIKKLEDQGNAILRYQKQQIDNIISSKMNLSYIFGREVPCINTTTLISEIGNELSKGYPFAVMYFDTDGKRVYSLRSSSDGVDVSEIAKKFGGGGHFNAAGFSIRDCDIVVNCYEPKPEHREHTHEYYFEINQDSSELFFNTGLTFDMFTLETRVMNKQVYYRNRSLWN